MAENTRMKEVYAELRKNSDEITRISEAFQTQLDRLETSHHAHAEQIATMQLTSDSQFTQLNSAMTQVLQRLQHLSGSSHGAHNSTKDSTRSSIQIRAQFAACKAPLIGDSTYMSAAIAEMTNPGLNPFGKYKKDFSCESEKETAVINWIAQHGNVPSVAIGLQACQISWDDDEHFYKAGLPWWRSEMA